VNRANPEPIHLATHADHLLRAGRAKEAGPILDQLANAEPEADHLRTLSLRVRWLKDQKQESQIPPLVAAFLKNALDRSASKSEKSQILMTVADLCSSVDLPKPAENCYRRALELDPLAYPPLAQWLSRQGRLREALELCLQAANTDQTPRPATVVANLLLVSSATDEDLRLAEPILDRALNAHGDQPALLLAIGTFRLVEGKNEEAIRLMRRTLELDPRNLGAMNNLSMLLSQSPQTQNEAIAYLDRALAIAGSNPELLDSKGWVLLKNNKLAQAESLFLEALALPPGDPRHRFHLALVYHLQGKLLDARSSLAQALADKLTVVQLSPDEKVELDKLNKALH
jgi:Flp pilus assembly protein TadD